MAQIGHCWAVRIALPYLFAASFAGAAPKLVQPAGIVLEGAPPCAAPPCKQGVLLTTNQQTLPIQALSGVLLFPGDTLENIDSSVLFVLCSDRKIRTMNAGSKASIIEGGITGSTETKDTVTVCLLPAVDRELVASGSQFNDEPPKPPPGQTADDRLLALSESQRAEFLKQVTPVEEALQRSADDRMAHIARAAILERFQLGLDAWDEYHEIADEWPAAVWARAKAQDVRPANQAPTRPGKTFALVVGVSNYEQAPPLFYAATDALTMADYLKMPRGGKLGKDDDLFVLTDAEATPDSVRKYLDVVFTKAGTEDTVVIFIAAHGVVAAGEGYVLTTYSNPGDLKTSALTMAEIQRSVFQHVKNTKHVLLFLDVCRAGQIGVIREPNTINDQTVVMLSGADRKLGAFMASAPLELAFEATEYGGGHGAFTYFLLRGLNGDADAKPNGNGDGVVTSLELVDYVKKQVMVATYEMQHPRDLVLLEVKDPLSRQVDGAGIALKDWSIPPEGRFRGGKYILTSAQRLAARGEPDQTPPPTGPAADLEQQFDTALAAGRLRIDQPESAAAVLDQLRQDANPVIRDRLRMFEARLQVALENRGENVVLKYLHGDQEPSSKDEFLEGARDFEAALRLAPDAQFDESRALFCRGRALIYDHQYDRARELLEQSIRLDPTRAYAFNALGIAYLEQIQRSQNTRLYDYATSAFQDAIRRAPYWTYPRHNLALALTQRGDVQRAAAEYRAAMDLGPGYSYLPYNLALLYHEIADFPQAKNYYREAEDVASKRCEQRLGKGSACPERALPLTGLAMLEIQRGNRRRARTLLDAALKDDKTNLTATHDKAALLADWRGHEGEADALWSANLKRDPKHLPSLIGYAELLSKQCRFADALLLYREIMKQNSNYVPAQIGLARALTAQGELAEANTLSAALVNTRPDNAQAWAARAEYLSHSDAPAGEAWEKALRLAKDRGERKQLANRRKGTGCPK